MAIVYSTTVKNTRLAAVVTALGSTATLAIGTSGLAGGAGGLLVNVPLANPAATVAGGVLTLAGVPRTATAVGTGVAAKAELRDGAGTVIASGLTVGTSGTDIIINAIDVSAGQTVQVTVGTITHG